MAANSATRCLTRRILEGRQSYGGVFTSNLDCIIVSQPAELLLLIGELGLNGAKVQESVIVPFCPIPMKEKDSVVHEMCDLLVGHTM